MTTALARGTVRVMWVPAPGSDWTSRTPPYGRKRSRMLKRPNPPLSRTGRLRPGHLETHPVIPHIHFQVPAFPLDGDLHVFGLSMLHYVDQQFIDRLKEENPDIFV